MLKRIWIVIAVALAGCFASAMTSVAVENANNRKVTTSNVVKDANEHLKGSRTFSGKIAKIGFFQRLRFGFKYKYCLENEKGDCFAFLDFNEKVRSPEVMKAFVGKSVIVKGWLQYINKEPYSLITVDDVSKQ